MGSTIKDKTIKVHIKAVGEIKNKLGEKEKEITCPEGITIKELLESIGINPHLVILSVVNGSLKSKDTVLKDGDKLLLADSFSGG